MIEAVCISKTFSSVRALHQVSLRVDQGDVLGIIGLSGAGKSTLLRCLAALSVPSSGEVRFHGVNVHSLKGKEKRAFHQKTGMIFQNFNLFSARTVFENIVYPLEIAGLGRIERQHKGEALLHLVGLEGKGNAYPSSLSGGQRQRVGIARALAGDPELLFCDEATSALDPQTTREILDLLQDLQKRLGLTVILITHDMGVVKKVCTKVAVLDAGEIVEQGLVREIFFRPTHPTTQQWIQSAHHEIPPALIRASSPSRKFLRLHFQGASAEMPLISRMALQYRVEANILLGWIDQVQNMTLGTLVVELSGEPSHLQAALRFLSEHQVRWEEMLYASD